MQILQLLSDWLSLPLGALLIIVGVKMLLEPIPTFGLDFGKQYLAKSRDIPIESINLNRNRQAAEALIFYLRKQPKSSCSRRGLARDFQTTPDEIDRITRWMEWEVCADKDLTEEYRLFSAAFEVANIK